MSAPRLLPLAISIIILLLPISAQAGDTPDTILMRQVLGNDLSSYRRADKERILRGYATHYIEVHSDGTSAADWTIRHENRDEFNMALDARLRFRTEAERLVLFVLARKEHGFATTVDSGRVVNRVDGSASPIHAKKLWFLNKKTRNGASWPRLMGTTTSFNRGETEATMRT